MCDSKSLLCPQDGHYYTGNRDTNCCFMSTKDGKALSVGEGGKTCRSEYFNKTTCTTQGIGMCPQGYTFKEPADPCKTAQICGYASGGGIQVPIWQLNKGCVGNEPKMDNNLKLRCCINDPPSGDFYGHCATGYCANNDTCVDVMKEYCVKNGLDTTCKKFFNVTNNTTSKRIVAQAIMDNWIKTSPDPLNNQHITDMTTLCSRLAPPGTCDQQLYKFCSTITRKDLNANPDYKNLCGCFMNEKEYDEFKAILKGAGALTDICDPLCASSQTQRGDQNCATDRCKSAICVVDLSDKNVQEIIQKNIAINQTCVTPKGGSSECYIAITGMDRKEMQQKNVHVNQNCGQCFLYDPNKPYDEGVNPKPVDCNNLTGGKTPPTSPPDLLPVTPVDKTPIEKYKVEITIAVSVILILLLLLVLFMFTKK